MSLRVALVANIFPLYFLMVSVLLHCARGSQVAVSTVMLYSCAGHLVPYVAAVKDPDPVTPSYCTVLVGSSQVTLSTGNL